MKIVIKSNIIKAQSLSSEEIEELPINEIKKILSKDKSIITLDLDLDLDINENELKRLKSQGFKFKKTNDSIHSYEITGPTNKLAQYVAKNLASDDDFRFLMNSTI